MSAAEVLLLLVNSISLFLSILFWVTGATIWALVVAVLWRWRR